MSTPIQKIDNDMSHLAVHARALLAATADSVGEHVKEAREALSAALDHGKNMRSRIYDQAASRAYACDQVVHENPYQAIGIAVGLGAVLGYLMVGGCGSSQR